MCYFKTSCMCIGSDKAVSFHVLVLGILTSTLVFTCVYFVDEALSERRQNSWGGQHVTNDTNII